MSRSIILAGLMAFAATAQAQHTHDDDQHGLHFVHPLVAESVSPDTKARINYEYLDPGAEHELALEGEYAFSRAFSVEVGVHFDARAAALGETHVTLKGASYVLEESGVLLGYGVAIDVPTGSDEGDEPGAMHDGEKGGDEHGGDEPAGHGHEGFAAGPFLNAGIKTGRAEIVGWATLRIPLEDEGEETHGEGETEAESAGRGSSLGYNFSTLYHVMTSLEVLLELDGQVALTKGTDRSFIANLTPGIKVQPLANSGLALGVGVSIPLTTARAFDLGIRASAFLHF